jgi:glycosyltransferase involved in cell wall biosynthesis
MPETLAPARSVRTGIPGAKAGSGAGPLVSVVIPTRGRPALLRTAVRSVLAQSHGNLEVIVVVDGEDPATARWLAGLDDPRLRVIQLARPGGGAAARNAGVEAAAGPWVALLDDDDHWLAHKIECQLSAATASRHVSPILCSRVIARAPGADYVWPRRMPGPGEPLSEYLFARRGLFQGEGVIQSSMVLAPRELLRRVPFDETLACHQDWDWVLRAGAMEGAGVVFVPEPLAVWHIEENRTTVTGGSDWRESLRWIDRSRPLVTRRAYAAFLMTSVSARAARAGAWSAFALLLWRSFRFGRPRAIDLAVFLGIWLVPQPLRWRLRATLEGGSRS